MAEDPHIYQVYHESVQDNLQELGRISDTTSKHYQELLTDTIETVHQMKLAAYAIRDPQQRRIALAQSQHYNTHLQDLAWTKKTVPVMSVTDSALDRLQAAHAQLIQTEQEADATLQELVRQGQQIRDVNTRTQSIQNEQNRARRFINNMMQWWRG